MNQANESYLEDQVMTATPQKLRLMLIDGAIRFARLTLQHWEQDNNERALESLIRCRAIVSELMSTVKPDESDLTKRVVGLYLFLFQQLTQAQLRRESTCVQEVIEILEVERETWRQVCEQMPNAPPEVEAHDAGPREIIAPSQAVRDDDLCGGSLNLDA